MRRLIVLALLMPLILMFASCSLNSEEANDQAAMKLMEAITKGDKARVEEILKETPGAVNADGTTGKYPLHVAAQEDRSGEIVQLLIDAGADPMVQDRSKQTPLQVASKANNHKALDIIGKAMAE